MNQPGVSFGQPTAWDGQTMPIPKIRERRNDQKVLILAVIGGLVLITAPLVVFSQIIPLTQSAGTTSPAPAPNKQVAVPRPTQSARPASQAPPPVESQVPVAETAVVLPLPAGPASLDRTGRLMILARSLDNTIMRNYQTKPAAGPPSGWGPLGGSAAGAPIVAVDGRGSMAAFMIGTDGAVWVNPETAPTASNVSQTWHSLGGNRLVGMPAAAQDVQGRFVLVARDADGALWCNYQNRAGEATWNGWQALPGNTSADPAIYRDSLGRLRIFALGPDGLIQTHTQTQPATNNWGSGQIPGGTMTQRPSVAMDGQGRLHVFSLGPDGSLQENVENGPDAWRGWQNLGGQLVGKPIAVADANNRLAVFALSPTGSVMQTYQTGPGNTRWYDFAGADGNLGGRHGARRWTSPSGSWPRRPASTSPAMIR
ncbi:hypothetical protein [Saccharopolyspora sp. 5N708]|uniref:hypothetical protein n=1 Tax=Saccharopolyspora sp. 5N708 TaxID=3457424 RepID=UPI003FD48705